MCKELKEMPKPIAASLILVVAASLAGCGKGANQQGQPGETSVMTSGVNESGATEEMGPAHGGGHLGNQTHPVSNSSDAAGH
jgi:hypothetical protein